MSCVCCAVPSSHSVGGGGPRAVVSTAAFHATVRGSVPDLGSLKGTKMFLPHPRVKVSIVGSLRDREVACSASDRQGSNFKSCVWRTVSSQSSHHPQEVLLAQFSLYVHKGGLKPDSFHFIQSDPRQVKKAEIRFVVSMACYQCIILRLQIFLWYITMKSGIMECDLFRFCHFWQIKYNGQYHNKIFNPTISNFGSC